MPIITIKTLVNAKRGIVFDLSRSIDLHQVSAKETNEKVIAGRISGLIELGETVTWRAKHLGVYQNLTAKITEFDYPNYFVDEMVKGAFKRFKHQHVFTTIEGDKTVVKDIFDYDSPLGILGNIADALFLKNYMYKFLKKRNEVIKQYAESENWKQLLN